MHAQPRSQGMLAQKMVQWAAQINEALHANGGSCALDALAGKAPLPQQLRGQGRYGEHIENHGFFVTQGVVYGLKKAPGVRRRQREDEAEDERCTQRRRTEPPAPTALPSALDAREAQARANRAKRFGMRAELPSALDVEEAAARANRAQRFGTPTEPARFVPQSRSAAPETGRGRPVKVELVVERLYAPRDHEQRQYFDHLQSAIPVVDKSTGELVPRALGQPARRGVVVALGSQGSGKTAFAIQEGLRALANGLVDQIVVSRPNIHAKGDGDGLGFLPGSEMDKLKPLAGPILDHIDEFCPFGTADRLLQSGQLKLCSFEYMRGTTFKRSWVIADEVQNCSLTQLRLLTGRYGDGSKMCILGDPEQCDRSRAHWEHSSLYALAEEIESGKHSDAWGCVQFGPQNCHRHPIAKESMDVMAAVEDRCNENRGSNAEFNRGRMFGSALHEMSR